MKKISIIAALILTSLLFTSCVLDGDSKDNANPDVRVKNNSSYYLYDTKVGNTTYGPLVIGATSRYKEIDQGIQTIYIKGEAGGSWYTLGSTGPFENGESYTIHLGDYNTYVTQD